MHGEIMDIAAILLIVLFGVWIVATYLPRGRLRAGVMIGALDEVGRKRMRVAEAFGIFGLVPAASLLAYMFATNFLGSVPLPGAIVLALCPAELFPAYLCFDFDGRSTLGVICGLIMIGLNGLVYFAFGLALARLVIRPKPARIEG